MINSPSNLVLRSIILSDIASCISLQHQSSQDTTESDSTKLRLPTHREVLLKARFITFAFFFILILSIAMKTQLLLNLMVVYICRYLKRSLKPELSLFFPAILLQSSPLHRRWLSSIFHGFCPHKFGKGHSPLEISGIIHVLECFFGVLLYSPLVCFYLDNILCNFSEFTLHLLSHLIWHFVLCAF